MGGTPAEVWTPKEVVSHDDDLSTSANLLQTSAWWPTDPGLCFNAMIDPITNFNIAGAIWYQGEGNTTNNSTYHKLFTSMIGAWRKTWNKNFPFYYVQIAPFKYGLNNVGALIQEAQTRSMSLPNTGMVVVTDLIDSVTNIHPSNRHDVGQRLANWALAETYNKKGIVYKSPAYKSKSTDKNKIVLSFNDVPNGFKANDAITGFYIFDMKEEVWLPAQAKIQNDKIIVWNNSAVSPLHVRYGFGNTMIGNVFSKEGLPLCPFRTDNFEIDQGPVK